MSESGPSPSAGQGAVAAGAGRLQPDSTVAGHYLVEAFVERGPYYEAYSAVDDGGGLPKPIHLQLVHRELLADAAARPRLEQDLAIARQLEHKNVSQLYGFWFDGGDLYLASEPADGQSLQEMLEKKRGTGRGFSLKAAYNVIAHLCNALTYAHGALAHGALTPSSIRVNAAGRVKVTDFGLGRALPLGLLRARDTEGVLSTLAPEAVTPGGAGIDRRSDVYSVGAILFELLTGQLVPTPYRPPSKSADGVPAIVDQVVAKCLAVSPEARYADVQELKHALHGALNPLVSGTPVAVVAVPPSGKAAAPTAPPPPAPLAASRPSAPMPVSAPSGPIPARPTPGMPSAPMASRPSGPIARAPIAAVAPGFNLDSALSAVDEAHERWLIQKDKLDFGPFRIGEVKHQIEKGQIKGDHTIVDMENGERRRVRDHALLRDLVLQSEGKFEDKARLQAEEAAAVRHKRNLLIVITAFGLVIAGVGSAVVWTISHQQPKEIVKTVVVKEEDPFAGITLKVDPPAPKKPKSSRRSGQRNASGEFDSATTLGDANEEGGDETLSGEVVQKVMSSNFGVLKGCVLEEKHRNPALKNVDMDFVIKGDGRVSAVKVNGDTQGTFATCMYGKMGSVSFPKFNGSKTHASFSLALK